MKNAALTDSKLRAANHFFQNLNIWILSVAVFLACTSTRIGLILPTAHLSEFFPNYMLFAFIIGSITLTLLSWSHSLSVFFLAGLILANSFCFLYQPSLKLGVPVQDWLLAENVSANYSFDQSYNYIKNLLIFIVPFFALNLSSDIPQNLRSKAPFFALLGGLFLNSLVALIQGLVDLTFLAQGSGSALSAGRASGLLEDSGASTVYFALMVSGLFSAILFSHITRKQRVICIAALLIVIISGAQTSGRIFFVASSIPSLILAIVALIRAIKTNSFRHALWLLVAMPLLAFAFYFLATWKMKNNSVGSFLFSVFESFDLDSFNRLLTALDPFRVIHWRVMLKTFVEHPFFGAGFGSFYSNLHEHAEWALTTGGSFMADPPASIYLMLLSELGLAGLIIILWASGRLFGRLRAALTERMDFTFYFCLGSSLSLAISLLIGVHFLFLSISSVFALVFISAPSMLEKPFFRPPAQYFGISGLLIFSSVYAAVTAPSPPAFKWLATGRPQVPLSLNVPIGAPGQGVWLQSGAEILLHSRDFSFFVELPPTSYPLSVQIKLKDQSGYEIAHGSHQIEKYTLPIPGKTLSFRVPESAATKCLNAISPNKFCSVYILTEPHWEFGRANLGFFVNSTMLHLP